MAATYPQIVLFGDSLFQGAIEVADGFSFMAALQSQVKRRFDVINRGFSGYNTSNALKVLPDIFPPAAPGGPKLECLFILFGANDACVPLPTNHQHVPLDRYKANLRGIINHPNIVAHKPKIFLVTPPPLDQIRLTELDLAIGHKAVTRHTKVSATYSQAVREVATEQGVVLVDLWKALMERAISKTPNFDPTTGPSLGDPAGGRRGYLEQLLPDGLHLSAESYRIFYSLVEPLLGSEWAGTPDEARVGYILPDWREAPWLDEDAHLADPAHQI
ncbi:SGNH hydrolase-type esterase domain-containing protein [Podospora aff. communis PSN243]|uniref:SGNH hydrolase-type esterase domain-containing protein n=1 Tax=Podospora aff. communis PSN243 TaxID=3040156 RepID=A0AAV9H7X8_9PEZI|nr:SGNH hydrolase-type esterase domain-containing protein [Podospora aff. communis PSN243]